jgi:hypothetical protein
VNRLCERTSILVLAAALLLGGCSMATGYRPDYVQPRAVAAEERIQGKALLVTSTEEDQYVFSGHPTSFTGSASTLSVPLGFMTRQIAETVFGEVCTEGVDHAAAAASGYAVIVRPKVTLFEFGYPQLKNLGFAITPEARVDLNVKLLGSDGQPLLDKDYSTGTREGKSYMLSGSPQERTSKLAHQGIYDLMREAAADIARHLRGANE